MNEWHQVNDNGEKEQLVRYTVVLRFTYRAVEQMSLVILIPCHCLLLVSWARRKDGCPLPAAASWSPHVIHPVYRFKEETWNVRTYGRSTIGLRPVNHAWYRLSISLDFTTATRALINQLPKAKRLNLNELGVIPGRTTKRKKRKKDPA